MEKVRVQNKTNHDVGIVSVNGMGRNIAPNAILPISYADFEYLASMSRLFTDKHLVVLDEEALDEAGLDKNEFTYETDESILDKLVKSKMPDFVKYLSSINEQHTKFRIMNLIKTKNLMDKLPANKINKINTIFNVDLNVELSEAN